MLLLAASSLHHAIFPNTTKWRKLEQIVIPTSPEDIYTIPGLSFNFRQPNPDKLAQNLLTEKFKGKKDVILRPDLINNSVSKHPANGSTLSPQ